MGEKAPILFEPYFNKMLLNIKKPAPNAILRNTLRTWQFLELPQNLVGEIYSFCFNILEDPESPIACRVFSMSICEKISLENPDLMEELIILIDENIHLSSAGFESRGNKVIKHLKQQIKTSKQNA